MRTAKFTIESLPNFIFDGFTVGEEWNGWACPYFSYEQGLEVADAYNKSSGEKASFDPNSGRFVFDFLDETEEYESVSMEGKTFYLIGSGAWIWEEVRNEEPAE